jgi:hypothetical protein
MSIRAAGHQLVQAAVLEMSKIGTRLYVDVAEFERVLVAARLSNVDERRAQGHLTQTLMSLPARTLDENHEGIKL